MLRSLQILLLVSLLTVAARSQGPCAEVEVTVLNSGYLLAEGAQVSFHRIVEWVEDSETAVAYTLEAEPLYTGVTSSSGAYRKRDLRVTMYEIRANGADGSSGSARIYCASASSSRIVIRMRE